jgi:hypothetical protein
MESSMERLNNNISLFEQALISSLNMDSWQPGHNFAEFYKRVDDEVKAAIANEEITARLIREKVMPELINALPKDISDKAIHQFDAAQIEKAHLKLLFNGCTEACDGTIVSHETLPLTITQIGICLVSYQGEQGAYTHRIFRKDLQLKEDDTIQEILQLLQQRRKGTTGQTDESNITSRSMLAQRGLMAYAERAILMEKSNARWRMGHGAAIPYELLTGFWAGREEMAKAAINLFEKIVSHKRFVYIPSTTKRKELITVGNGLRPLEYIIVGTAKADLLNIIENGGAREPMVTWQTKFANQYGDDIIMGLFKTSSFSPAYIFYAHKEYVQTAALIAIADSLLQEYRGFPMLIDIADNICSATFGANAFYATIQNAYAQNAQPFRFLGERETRPS